MKAAHLYQWRFWRVSSREYKHEKPHRLFDVPARHGGTSSKSASAARGALHHRAIETWLTGGGMAAWLLLPLVKSSLGMAVAAFK